MQTNDTATNTLAGATIIFGAGFDVVTDFNSAQGHVLGFAGGLANAAVQTTAVAGRSIYRGALAGNVLMGWCRRK